MFIAVGFPIIGLILIIASSAGRVQDKNRLFCKDCKVKYNFENDVAYKQIDHKVSTFNYNANNSKGDRQIRSRERFKLQVSCTCPKCRKSKSFTHQVTGRETYYDGRIVDKDPERQIQEYFTKPGKQKLFWSACLGIGIVCLIVGVQFLLHAML